MQPQHLELLAPARDADIGIEAIRHGADAVYIGGPSFGARASAGNSLSEIARLVEFAQRFHARIFVALNTILTDAELAPAQRQINELYDAGVAALIIQDMGLLELALPPIELHASTQCDIRTPAKARFLQDVGFSQIVLARELSLPEIADIRAATDSTCCTLEYFVHGALCVAFSGQCYISHAHTGRSANRGECSQACRLPYTLQDAQGRIVAYDKHLLSMKDNDQSANLVALIDAGIRSFKIEGRYKDMSYVKNVVAHYRQLIDAELERRPELAAASSGRVRHSFTPQIDKTFNRGTTDYFTHGRQHDIGAFDTPKFAGSHCGVVSRVGPGWFEVDSDIEFHNGDGISWQPQHSKGANKQQGLRINVAQGSRLYPNELPDNLKPGDLIARNRDQAFERQLEKPSAERKIGVQLALRRCGDDLRLQISDQEGYTAEVQHPGPLEPARNLEQARETLQRQLGKLGDTDFEADAIDLAADALVFLPAASLNALRRQAVNALQAARLAHYPRGQRAAAASPPLAYPETALSYLANVHNQAARRFYQRHGVTLIEDAYEADTTAGEVSLMITKHCLRHSFDLCPKEAKDWQLKGIKAEPMTLINGKEKLTLRFDCKACEMHVIGSSRQKIVIPLHPAD